MVGSMVGFEYIYIGSIFGYLIWFCTFVLYFVRKAGVYIVFVYFKECYHTQFQLKLILIPKRT